MPDASKNLWAPWRMEYIRSLQEEGAGPDCFLCQYWSEPENDAEHYVVWRTRYSFVLLNRFPYTNGHLLVAHAAHKAELTDFDDDELREMTCALRDATRILRRACDAEGFNVGYNLGRCAGAGLPGHLHAHVVPRWTGDTNFMTVVGDARVLSDSLQASYEAIQREARTAGLCG